MNEDIKRVSGFSQHIITITYQIILSPQINPSSPNMKFTLLLVTLTASALAAPSTAVWRDEKRGLEVRGLGDKGNGFYSVAFDANGKGEVKFQPWAKLNHTGEAAEVAKLEATRAANNTTVEKRGVGTTTCTGEWVCGSSNTTLYFFTSHLRPTVSHHKPKLTHLLSRPTGNILILRTFSWRETRTPAMVMAVITST